MTNEERDIIANFLARVGGAAQQSQTPWGGSVPATTQPALPPVDREADTFISELFNRYPEARYRLTQLAFVQEHALAEAQNRIQRLEADLQQARQVQPQQAPQPQQGGGFLGGLFGGGQRPAAAPPSPAWNQGAPPPQPQYAPPPPQYAPGNQPGMFQRSGSGFLGSALTTAAGVAGGLVVGNALMGLFSPHPTYGGGFGGGMAPMGGSPWGAPGGTPEQGNVDQGNWDNNGAAAPDQGSVDQGSVDQGTWDQPDSSSSDPGSFDTGGGGFDSGGGGSDDSLF
ncbi:MAG TPA: DUF2076 family protein [Acetobacteraceae bacterium]|jgi:hypothetical protein|nr:DUF2076 family protein [Acetobacteraceae bacterium]